MINLPNNCYCSDLAVFPKNWKLKDADMGIDWYVHYRFYDPSQKDKYPKGKPVIIKDGINRLKTLKERRDKIRDILRVERDLLQNDGINPITRKDITDTELNRLSESTGFIRALEIALKEKQCNRKTKLDIDSMLRYFTQAAIETGKQYKPVNQVKFSDINLILKRVSVIRAPFSNARYNKYRTYLMLLYTELLEMGAVDHNPVRDIRKKKEKISIRETLTREQRQKIAAYLTAKGQHRFLLYSKLFFHSGIRSTEMLALKAADINLVDQLLKCTIRKGSVVEEVYKTIKDIAVPLWRQAVENCKAGDFIFSRGLMPGPVKIDESQITRRWNRHIKKGMGITADFYAFKHANTTELSDHIGHDAAAELNSHKGTGMVVKIYDVKQGGRNHDEIRKAGNEF